MNPRLTIAGLGEALFDVFADHQTLGGAPLNVAVHAHQLLFPIGGRGVVASRVGRDDLGREVIAAIAGRGMPTDAIQIDDTHATGRVNVRVQQGDAEYEIVENVAWDQLEFEHVWSRLAGSCEAVCFGTLARRGARSREAIGQFLRAASQAIRLFDVNLRHAEVPLDLIREGCALATIVKLNEAELPRVCHALNLELASQDDQASAIRRQFALDAVVLTRGAAGTTLYERDGKTDGPAVRFPAQPGADSVGAGDACSAGILVGRLLKWPSERVIDLANRLGAYVASQPGATPSLPAEVRAGIDQDSRLW